MSKKKVKINAEQINSWEDAEGVLRRLAELRMQVRQATAEYNEREQARRAQLTAEITPKNDQIESLELGLREFVLVHRSEFEKTKHRVLTHGIVGFRTDPPSIKQIKGFTVNAVLKLVKASKWAWRFVRTKEEINKEEVLAALQAKDVTPDDLAPLGLQRVQEEQFYYELKLAAQEPAS